VRAPLADMGVPRLLLTDMAGAPAGFGEELARSLGLDLRTLRQSLAAVSEFKGDAWGQGDVVGVVRFVQVNRALCRVEAALDGLAPGKHILAVHTFGACQRVSARLDVRSRHALCAQAT
jgi:Cu/Zn superoxide dismutase